MFDASARPPRAPPRPVTVSLVVHQLSVTYADGTRALDGVSLEAGRGLFGLLGPNGAGKSTLLRVVATLQRPDAGRVLLDGADALADPAGVRARLGYLPQDFGLYPQLGVEETLDHFAELKGFADRAERRAEVHARLAQTGLGEHRRRSVRTLSGGMRQRLGLAIALAGRPSLLVLDEPTAGLDPAERHRLYDLLAEAAADAVVLLSTHIVEDVRELCRAFAILDRGQVRLAGDPRDAVAALRGRVWQRAAGDDTPAAARRITRRRVGGDPVERLLADTRPASDAVPVEPTLEDAYFLNVEAEGGSASDVER